MNPRPLGPEPSALPNCATPRWYPNKYAAVVPRPLGPSSSRSAAFSHRPKEAMLACALRSSSSQKSRCAAIFGSPALRRATKLRYTSMVSYYKFAAVVPRPLGPSSSRSAAFSHRPKEAMLACALRSSSSQKSRCAAIFGSPALRRATKLRYTSMTPRQTDGIRSKTAYIF